MSSRENNWIARRELIKKEAEKLLEKASKSQGKEAEKLFRGAGKKFYDAYIIVREQQPLSPIEKKEPFPNFQEQERLLLEKVSNCYEQAGAVATDPFWRQASFGKAASFLFEVLLRMTQEEISLEAPANGKVYRFDEASTHGKIISLYVNAAIEMHSMGKDWEEEKKSRAASLAYGRMGDLLLCAALFGELIPKDTLFHDPNNVRERFFQAADCFVKAFKLQTILGIPGFSSYFRMVEHDIIPPAKNFFKVKEGEQEITIANDEEKARLLYQKIRDEPNGEIRERASRRLEELDKLTEGRLIPRDNNILQSFEGQLRYFIRNVLGPDFLQLLEQNRIEEIRRHQRLEERLFGQDRDLEGFLDFGDYRKIIEKGWKQFRKIFGEENREKILFRLQELNQTFRRPLSHNREIGFSDHALAERYIRWFQTFFQRHSEKKMRERKMNKSKNSTENDSKRAESEKELMKEETVDNYDVGAQPKKVDVSEARDEEDEERILRNAWPPIGKYFFEWLKTPDGASMAKKLTDLLGSIKRETFGGQHKLAFFDLFARYGLVFSVLAAAVYLRTIDKLDTVMVGLLSAALGFLLGRQKLK